MGSSEKAKFVKHSSFVKGHRLSQLPTPQMSHSCSPPCSLLRGGEQAAGLTGTLGDR